jgi:zinc transport system permease protein
MPSRCLLFPECHLLFLGGGIGIWAILLVVAVALLIGWLSRRHRLDEANTATVFLSVAMALAIILVRLNKAYTFDLAGYLFGDILLITRGDVLSLAVLLGVNCSPAALSRSSST